jgi:hypothetical protein
MVEMEADEPESRCADDIRTKRINQELALLQKLDRNLFSIRTDNHSTGYSIFVEM